MSIALLKSICLASAVIYGAALILSLAKKERLSIIAYALATLLSGALVINNTVVNGYVPFVSMYQVLTFLAFIFTPIYLYARYIHGGKFMKKYFIATQCVIMCGVFFMDHVALWSFPPALQSAYFVPHVLSYMISYSLTAIAAILCIAAFVKPSVAPQYKKGVYFLIITAFPFTVLGMLLGALWANACWGHYWSWDLKEAWSLVTLLSLTVYLHFRRQSALCKYAEIFVILSLVFEIITLFFVGMFGSDSVHAYTRG